MKIRLCFQNLITSHIIDVESFFHVIGQMAKVITIILVFVIFVDRIYIFLSDFFLVRLEVKHKSNNFVS